jgi:hypothetical protein
MASNRMNDFDTWDAFLAWLMDFLDWWLQNFWDAFWKIVDALRDFWNALDDEPVYLDPDLWYPDELDDWEEDDPKAPSLDDIEFPDFDGDGTPDIFDNDIDGDGIINDKDSNDYEFYLPPLEGDHGYWTAGTEHSQAYINKMREEHYYEMKAWAHDNALDHYLHGDMYGSGYTPHEHQLHAAYPPSAGHGYGTPQPVVSNPTPRGPTKCFPGEVIVVTSIGVVPIAELEKGHMIVGLSTGTLFNIIFQIEKREVHEGCYPLYEIILGKESLLVADKHYFCLENGQWELAENLQSGQYLKTLYGQVKIDQINYLGIVGPMKVYNLKVEDGETYAVSELGIIVRDW